MRLYIIRLKDVFGKGDSIFLAEFLAGADVNIDFTIFGPRVQANMALGNDHKTG